MWIAMTLFGCGGPDALSPPHDPPAWPMENIRSEPAPEVPAAPPQAPPAPPPEADAPVPQTTEPAKPADEPAPPAPPVEAP